MSTKGYVVIGNMEKWQGIPCYYDAYPWKLGVSIIYQIRRFTFGGLCNKIEENKTWEELTGKPYSRENEYINGVDNESANPLKTSFVYVLNKETREIHILKSFCLLFKNGTNISNIKNVDIFKRGIKYQGSFYGHASYWFEHILTVNPKHEQVITEIIELKDLIKIFDIENLQLRGKILMVEKYEDNI